MPHMTHNLSSVQRSRIYSRQFKEHYDLYLGLQFNCDDCDKVFPSKQKLVDHKQSDQMTEAAHQYLNKRLLRSNYRLKDIESHAHGLKLSFFLSVGLSFYLSDNLLRL